MTTDFPTAPSAYGLYGPSAAVTVEKSTHASHTEILTPPFPNARRLSHQNIVYLRLCLFAKTGMILVGNKSFPFKYEFTILNSINRKKLDPFI